MIIFEPSSAKKGPVQSPYSLHTQGFGIQRRGGKK